MSTVTALCTPGERLTVKADGAGLTGGRFVMVAATKPTTGAAIPAKVPTGATVPLLGVVAFDCVQNAHTQLFTHGHVVPVEVGTGGVTAGTAVMTDTAGKAIAHTGTNVKAGIALTTSADGEFAHVLVNLGL